MEHVRSTFLCIPYAVDLFSKFDKSALSEFGSRRLPRLEPMPGLRPPRPVLVVSFLGRVLIKIPAPYLYSQGPYEFRGRRSRARPVPVTSYSIEFRSGQAFSASGTKPSKSRSDHSNKSFRSALLDFYYNMNIRALPRRWRPQVTRAGTHGALHSRSAIPGRFNRSCWPYLGSSACQAQGSQRAGSRTAGTSGHF